MDCLRNSHSWSLKLGQTARFGSSRMRGIVLSCSDKKKDKPLVDHSALVKRKKEHQSYKLDEEGELAAQKRKISTCCLVHLHKDYVLRLCLCLASA